MAAIVEDRARTTRDRIYDTAEWNGRRFIVVDTGGLEARPGDPIEERVQEQARLAISEADVIVLVTTLVTMLALEWRLTLLALVVMPLFIVPPPG